ncbi:MAG TPA: class I SAM-dependent methyltransferase [Micromonosporaceae bacterium]|jgi:SAM-dependent methyltransferase|nr:class I SAM-dependent methyltransferase [Micromonosporaceae bacterium]
MTDALTRWRAALESWAIPPEILARAPESPWTLAPDTFVARARRQVAAPSGESYDRAVEALPAGGYVLDVGAGAGAASLALSGRAARLTGVDTNRSLLETFADLATDRNVDVQTVVGTWPDCAESVGPADVVVCYHVLYNVADLAPFVTALSAYARSRVVVEITATHPMTPWNPLWQRFHGLERPRRPTATDAVEAISELGYAPQVTRWERPATLDSMSYAELVITTCRRLCLGPERADDVDAALRDLGVDPAAPTLGGPTRRLVTIWWPGVAD